MCRGPRPEYEQCDAQGGDCIDVCLLELHKGKSMTDNLDAELNLGYPHLICTRQALRLLNVLV